MLFYTKSAFLRLSVLLAVLAKTSFAQRCDIRCKCSKSKMACNNYMPLELPDGIKVLTIEGQVGDSKVNEFWTDNSWNRLESLTLQNYYDYIFSEKYQFGNLVNLSYFGLHSNNFDQLENSHLKAMPYLKELDLSGTARLRFPTIISALSGGNLPNLEVLNLDSVASDAAFTSINRFDKSFIEVLLGKPLRKLIITNTMFEIDATLLFQIHTLEFVNFSGPWTPALDMKFPLEIIKTRPLNTLDLSVSMISVFKLRTDYVMQNLYAVSCQIDPFIQLLMATANVYLNDVSDMRVALINVTYNMTDCLESNNAKFKTKTLHLRKNNLKKLDVKFIDNKDMDLTFLDLSDNILEYLSPEFFKIFGNLLSLDLSSNYLGKMEYSSRFNFLFSHLSHMNVINLSANQISVIPNNIFIHNKHLAEIDLSLNKLSTVKFNIQQLHELRLLNLVGNRIKFIEMNFLQQLDKLSIHPSFKVFRVNERTTKVILLKDNQFFCSCNSVAFLNWLISRQNRTDTNSTQNCLLEGSSKDLDQDVIEKSRYLCIKDAVTIAIYTSSVSFFIAIVSILLGCYIHRRRRIKDDGVKRLIQTLRDQILCKYLLFFSYCGEDEQLAMEVIYPRLSEALRTCVDCNEDLICVGNLNFRPGFPIHEEMLKCISESCVVVLLVSNAFCESRWCETEVQEAATQNKPIVLFLVDYVDEDVMSPYLQTLFRRYTRVIVTTNNNKVELKPDMNTICQSVLELAADTQKYGGFYELFNTPIHGACCKI